MFDKKTHANISPYAVNGLNPISNIDPLGLDWFRNTETGEVYWEDRDKDGIKDGEEYVGAVYLKESENGFVLHHQNKVIASGKKSDGVTKSDMAMAQWEYFNIPDYDISQPINARASEALVEMYDLIPEALLTYSPGMKTPTPKSFSPKFAEGAAKGSANALKLRPDVVLSGGRSGQLVKNLTGPANSVLRGGGNRIFITDDAGKVIWDITTDRAKSVIPGKGFGPKVTPTQDQLNLLKKILGN